MHHEYDVFISYSHEDRPWVWDELIPALEETGLRVCIDDRDFQIGVPVLQNIEWAVERSRHTLLVLTPDWIESEWAEFEALLAGSSDPSARRQKLLPLLLRQCQLPLRLKALTYADFTDPNSHKEQIDRLLGQLQSPAQSPGPSSEDTSVFTVGPPIMHPRHFFGRERELKRLFGLLKRLPLQNAAIIGRRRSGKTSLLQYLKNITTAPQSQLRSNQKSEWLSQPERYRWIFIDFQDPRLGTRDGLLSYVLDQLGLPTPESCSLGHFMDVVSRNLRNPTVILMDEIAVALERYSELDDTFWEGIRSLATNQVRGNLAFVLSSHERPDRIAHQSGHSSPFFNIFGYTSRLGPLHELHARELIASSPFPFPSEDIEWILRTSGRWPILLQILCRERLMDLESDKTGNGWREAGLQQIEPFQYLLEAEE